MVNLNVLNDIKSKIKKDIRNKVCEDGSWVGMS
jgi:hypothetical protein